jgi:hypothetical protein
LFCGIGLGDGVVEKKANADNYANCGNNYEDAFDPSSSPFIKSIIEKSNNGSPEQ